MCGLFGFIAQEKTPLAMETFLHLGCANDSRGGDSVGIFIDKSVEYGVDKQKLFYNFFSESKLLPQVKSVNVAVGHTRKASIGKVGLETAQPVVIKNKNGEVDFVLLHNGTISNYIDLQNKYLTNVPLHYTDSQTMAYCLYYQGFDILKEYVGAGMFVMIDYREDRNSPTVSFFKGGSKENTWSKTVDEERPFYILETNKGIWFSSLMSPLLLKAYGTPYEVVDLDVNKVFSFVKAKLVNTLVIDRSEKIQKKFVSSTYSNNYYNEWERDYENTGKTVTTPPRKDVVYTKPSEEKKKIVNFLPVMSLSNSAEPEKVEYLRGVYCNNSGPITGELVLTDWGFTPSLYVPSLHSTFYFYNGILIYGKNALTALQTLQKQMNLTEAEFCELCPEIVYNAAASIKYDPQTRLCEKCNDYEFVYCNGMYFPLFNPIFPHAYSIEGGEIKFSIEKKLDDVTTLTKEYTDKCKAADLIPVDQYLAEYLAHQS